MTNGINYEVHGCVEVHSEYGSNVERVEDDREAEFFTAYNWDGDSIQWAVQDFNSRLEAEAWVKAAERGDVLNLRDRGIRWQVRVIREGDRYGLDGQLTRENGTPTWSSGTWINSRELGSLCPATTSTQLKRSQWVKD